MKTAQFNLFLVILIVVFSGIGYFGYRSVDFTFDSPLAKASSPTVVFNDQEPEALDNTENLTENESDIEPPKETEPQKPAPTTGTIPQKYAGLATRLENLIKDDIHMKIGSRGTRVGTVQEFLNVYENKSVTIDNGYGEGTKSRVLAFQKAVSDEPDGLADPGTYQKMLDWLRTTAQ